MSDNLPDVYASGSVTDTLAHVVAVLIEVQHQCTDGETSVDLDSSVVESAIQDGSALVEILRTKRVDAHANAVVNPRASMP